MDCLPRTVFVINRFANPLSCLPTLPNTPFQAPFFLNASLRVRIAWPLQ